MGQVRFLRRAMKTAGMDEHKLAETSGVDITLIRRYLEDDPEKRVKVGEKNAPRIAKALNLTHDGIVELLFGSRAA